MKFAMGCLFSAVLGGMLAVALCESPLSVTSAVGEETRSGPRLPDDGASRAVPRSGARRAISVHPPGRSPPMS